MKVVFRILSTTSRDKMAPSSKTRVSSGAQPVLKASILSIPPEWVRPCVIGSAILLFFFLVLDEINQGGISCFFPKHYSLKLTGRIRGAEQPCGDFKVGGVSYLKGGQIEVMDTDHNRLLIFDMKGQFLSAQPPSAPIQNTAVTDPLSGLIYTTDFDKSRIVVTDSTGKVKRSIYVRDKPVAVGLDGKGTLFVGFGNHYFLQAYSLSGHLKGDGRVENPDPDETYLDVVSLSGTDQGLLLAADPRSVWIYQLPQ
jgi:hypothetical protein